VLATAASVAAGAVSLPRFSLGAQQGSRHGPAPAILEHVRVARHARFDRVVFEFRSGTPAWLARYVPTLGPAGPPVVLPGVVIRVVFRGASVDRARAGGPEIVRTLRLPVLRRVKETRDAKRVVFFELGLRRLAPFRAFRLSDPGRLVVDVAH
jgi:hypothetical protein